MTKVFAIITKNKGTYEVEGDYVKPIHKGTLVVERASGWVVASFNADEVIGWFERADLSKLDKAWVEIDVLKQENNRLKKMFESYNASCARGACFRI